MNRPQSGLTGDPRDRKPQFDLYKVDYKWVEQQTSEKELKAAFKELTIDGGFPDLLKAVRERLRVVDPSFKTTADFNNYTHADEQEANADVMNFLDEMNQNDKAIRGETGPMRKGGQIFDDKNPSREQSDS